jgi:hypothetical protein
VILERSVEECLVSTMARIPQVQHEAKLLQHTDCGNKGKMAKQLFNDAKTLDCELSEWAHTVKDSWTISAATNLNFPSTSKFTPLHIHKYSNFYVARVWNKYRVSRLVVQSIMLRTISWLPHSCTRTIERATIERSSQDLIDGICASVSFLFGQSPAGMKTSPATELGDSQLKSSSTTEKAPASTGRFSLIWPLYIACSASFISEEQRAWMRAQLRVIAECGDPQAQLASCTESQVLTGGVEQFRFDCV